MITNTMVTITVDMEDVIINFYITQNKKSYIDGMKAARILRTTGNKAIIVFVTAVEEYVFEAFLVLADKD